MGSCAFGGFTWKLSPDFVECTFFVRLFAAARGVFLLPTGGCAGWSPRRASHFGVRLTSLREVSEPPLREHLLRQMKVTKAKTLSTLLYRFGCFLPRLVSGLKTRTTAHLFNVPHRSARCASSR